MTRLKLVAFLPTALAALLTIGIAGQARDADTVLREMRAALGGEAALDAIKTLSVSGSQIHRLGGRNHETGLELFVMLPDHYLTVTRDSAMLPGPTTMSIDTTNYSGFRGDVLIRRTDSSFPVPPDPEPDAVQLQSNKRRFARIALALFAKGFAAETFSYVGPETIDKQAMEVIEMREANGFAVRLYVNTATHLPALIAWQAPPPMVFTATMTSTATVRGGQVVSQTPPVIESQGAQPTPGGDVLWRTVFSDYKLQDGLNWPHRLTTTVGDKPTDEMRLGKFKLNPKIDARRFDIRR